MESDEPIKALMIKTLNLMIEVEFEVKIGAKKSEQTPERKRSPDDTKLYRCEYRTMRFDTTCGTLMLKIPHPNIVIHDTLTYLEFPEYSPKKSQSKTCLRDSTRNFVGEVRESVFSRTLNRA